MWTCEPLHRLTFNSAKTLLGNHTFVATNTRMYILFEIEFLKPD